MKRLLKALLVLLGIGFAIAIVGYLWPLFVLLVIGVVALMWRNPNGWGTRISNWQVLQRVPGLTTGSRPRVAVLTVCYLVPMIFVGGVAAYGTSSSQATVHPTTQTAGPTGEATALIASTTSTSLAMPTIAPPATAIPPTAVPPTAVPIRQPPPIPGSSSPTSTPKLVPYPFTIAKAQDITVDRSRPRWTISALIPDGGDSRRMALTCATIAWQSLTAHPSAKVVSLFGISSSSLLGQGFDRCRASASVDGKGWTGDGQSFINFLPDQGDALVEVGNVLQSSPSIFRVTRSGSITLLPPEATPTPAPTTAPAPISRYLDDVIKFDPNPTIMQNGEQVVVLVGVTNTDKVSHTFDAQANLHSVAENQLGDDPAQFLVTVGSAHLTLASGEKRRIEIDAKNFLRGNVASVDFMVVGR